MKPVWVRAAEYAEIRPDDQQIELMSRYGHWLATEGWRAGGIGPKERDRIDLRHLADSVIFATCLPDSVGQVWDLGSGVGLPGIPLAICLPETRFVLVDRSGRRSDLMRRIIRILDLPNCQVWQEDIGQLWGSPDAIVSRASLPPDQLRAVAEQYLGPGGVAVVGGSWRDRPEEIGWTTVEIPPFVLDRSVWLLIMRRQ